MAFVDDVAVVVIMIAAVAAVGGVIVVVVVVVVAGCVVCVVVRVVVSVVVAVVAAECWSFLTGCSRFSVGVLLRFRTSQFIQALHIKSSAGYQVAFSMQYTYQHQRPLAHAPPLSAFDDLLQPWDRRREGV